MSQSKANSNQQNALAGLLPMAVACLLGFLLSGTVAYATGEVPNAFTLSGLLYNSLSTVDPLLDPSVNIEVQILDPSKVCVLYSENQTINTMDTEGTFNIQVGSLLADSKRTAGVDPGNTMLTVYQNSIAMTATCAGSVYIPALGDVRYIRLIVTSASLGVTDTLTPDILLGSVPTALVAERAENLQGLGRAGFLQLGTVADLIQANFNIVFSPTNYPKLLSLLGGSSTDYIRSSTSAGAPLPSLAAAPGGPTTGNIWYNSTSNTIQYYNGSTVHTLNTVSGTITALTSDVSASGTGSVAATVNSVGGSTAANVNAATVLANAATDVNTNSAIVRRSGSGNFNGSAVSMSSAVLRDSGAKTVTLTAPATVGTSYTLRIPEDQGGGSEVLTNDGLGNLTWSGDHLVAASTFSGDVSGTYDATSVDKIAGVAVTAPTLAGQVLRFDGGAIAPNFVGVTDLRSNITGSTALAATCGASETLTYNSAMDNLACSPIAIASTAVSGLDAGYLKVGGNSLGAATVLGTADVQNLSIVTDGTPRMTVLATGEVGIGDPAPAYPLVVVGDINSTTSLRVDGTQVCTSGGCTAVSDESLKECIQPMENSLEKVLKLEGVNYEWRDPKRFAGAPKIGFIAQELEKVFPEVVRVDKKTGLRSVAYDHLVAPVVEAIKSLHSKLLSQEADLRKENVQLREQLALHAKEIASLKTYLCKQDAASALCAH